MPPEWMWPLSDELDEHFTEVDRSRRERYGLADRDDEGPEMLSNDLARGRRGR